MSEQAPTPYRVMLLVSDDQRLSAWVKLASALCPQSGEIRLRGMITIPEGVSLSEGATRARQLRESLDQIARELDTVHDETIVHVDYHPLQRALTEIAQIGADLLIVQWQGTAGSTGGLSSNDILRSAPCDLILLRDGAWDGEGPVLLSLRGGPNLELGLRAAKALAGESAITLLHVADSPRTIPNLSAILSAEPRITRAITVISRVAEGIVRESARHKVIVMGATFQNPSWDASRSGPLAEQIESQTETPVMMVRAHNPEESAFHFPRRRYRPVESLSTKVDRWFAQNTFHSREFSDLAALVALKERQGVTISVGLPALNEEATVGKVIATLKYVLMDEYPLIDELVLIDSNSEDNTVQIAQDYGIPVYKHPEILPEMGTYRGKGEALWKSQHVIKVDLIAWVDTDIVNIQPHFVYGLVGPLLKRPNIQYVKGFYQRPIKIGDTLQAGGGGRVTELVARPWLNLFYPELSGIIQPLSGEYAGRRSALERVPFFSGYGVETGLLIDLHEQHGLESIAQVDLEERVHYNQPLVNLSKMSFAIQQVFISRMEKRYGMQILDKANRSMKLIIHEPDRFALDIAEIVDQERPPMIEVPAYMTARA